MLVISQIERASINVFIDLVVQVVFVRNVVIKEGEWISLNGSTGEVILGKQPLSPPALSGDLETFMSWADKIRHLKVQCSLDPIEGSSCIDICQW